MIKPNDIHVLKADPSDHRAVTAGIEAYGRRQFQQAFELLSPVLEKLNPDKHPVIHSREQRQSARTAFAVLTQLADIFPDAQYRAAKTELYGFTGMPTDLMSGLARLADAAKRGHLEAMAHLAKFHVKREKPVAYFWLTLSGLPHAIAFRNKMVLEMAGADLDLARQLVKDYTAGRPVDFKRRPPCETEPDRGNAKHGSNIRGTRRGWAGKSADASMSRAAKAEQDRTSKTDQREASEPENRSVSDIDRLVQALREARTPDQLGQIASQASPKIAREAMGKLRAARPRSISR